MCVGQVKNSAFTLHSVCIIECRLFIGRKQSKCRVFKAPIRARSVANLRSVPLSRCCFPSACGAPPAPGFQGNSTSWLYPSARFEPFRGCPRNAELAGHTGRIEARESPETAPPQKPLNDASGANRFAISNTVITDLDIFRLRPLRFLLLRFSRKSFAKSQKPFRKFPA